MTKIQKTTGKIPSYMLRSSRFRSEMEERLGKESTGIGRVVKSFFQTLILFYTWKI